MRVRGLGPKCISASHLCLPNKPVIPGTILSKSQNALSTTPSGYILSTVNKKINITKVDDVREWLDNPIVLREESKVTVAEKRQSMDNPISESEFNFQNKSRKVDDTLDKSNYKKIQTENSEFKEPDLGLVKVLKSKSQNCNSLNQQYVSDLPSYLRNQSVEELESDRKMAVDVLQPISRHFSIPNQDMNDDSKYSSDSDDVSEEVKPKSSPGLSFRNIFKNDSNMYTVNPDESSKSKQADNNKRKINISKNIQQLRQNFEPKQTEVVPDKSKSFNTFAKKLLSPKLNRKSMNNPLTKIFQPHSLPVNEDNNCKDTKINKKGKSTFFVSKPHSEINKSDDLNSTSSSLNNVEKIQTKNMKTKNLLKSKPPKVNIWPTESNISDLDLISNSSKSSNTGKCITPLMRRHNRQNDDIIGSVGRFSYREKRTSPLKYSPPDKTIHPEIIKPTNSTFISKNDESPLRTLKSLDSDNCDSMPNSAPLIRCSNFKHIPSLNSETNTDVSLEKKTATDEVILVNDNSSINTVEDNTEIKNSLSNTNLFTKPTCFSNSELGISTSNYVSLANLRINCPSLGRTRESLVRRNISKFDSNGRNSFKNKINTEKPSEKCVPDVESSSLHLVNECKKPLESTLL